MLRKQCAVNNNNVVEELYTHKRIRVVGLVQRLKGVVGVVLVRLTIVGAESA